MCIINDETVEISYEAPKIENDIGEQRQVVDGAEDEFKKNKDIEHEQDFFSKTSHPILSIDMCKVIYCNIYLETEGVKF